MDAAGWAGDGTGNAEGEVRRFGSLQELPDSKCKTPLDGRGLQHNWSRKEELLMVLLLLLVSLVLRLRRLGIKIDFWF